MNLLLFCPVFLRLSIKLIFLSSICLDITKKALAEITGATGWHIDERQEKIITDILDKRGIAHTSNNIGQALVPDNCKVILNKCGMAPITVYRPGGDRFPNHPVLYSLPGVPYEATGALPDIMQDIRNHFSLSDIYHKTLVTFGIPESIMSDMISDWEAALPEDMKLAYLQCRSFPELLSELRQALEIMEPEYLSPGLKVVRRNLLTEL